MGALSWASRTWSTIFYSKYEVGVPKNVIAELIQGADSEKNLAKIRTFIAAFSIGLEGDSSWVEAGNPSYRKKTNVRSLL
jgi:predicted nucleic acid-binding protein